jgi:hypothetical protein
LDDKEFPGHLDEFARTIHDENIFEQMGTLFLVHDNEDNLSFHDMLGFHANWETDTSCNFLYGGRKTFFDNVNGQYVTGVYTASHTKLVQDFYHWKDDII